MASPAASKPHVVLIPYPAQGHVTPFLRLAKALHARSFHVTFHTEFNRARLLRSRGAAAVAGADGLPPPGQPAELDATQDIWAICEATRRTGPGHVRALVERLGREAAAGGVPPVSFVVADGAMGFAVHVTKEMGIPTYLFFTHSACGLLAYLNFDQLVKRGYVPLKDESCLTNGYLDNRLDWVAGMIAGVRLRDLPTFIRTTDPDDVMLNITMKQCELDAPAADGILLNTFDGLERAALDAIRARLPNTIAVGPSARRSRRGPLGPEREDGRCAAWLDAHADAAVVYANFGSITVMGRAQVGEFARGLAAAGAPFLWVIRPDMVRDAGDGDGEPLLPEGFEEEVVASGSGRGLMVGWCDQEAVLGHRATGAFLSHCGWNSTVESLAAGVPMLCWPFFSEQVTNCRYACEEWGVGVEMARDAGRREVEAAVREVMGGGEKAAAMRRKAAAAVAPGGSSRRNLESLFAEIAGGVQPVINPV
uniref:Glycosyltransferase n=1 Tax=Oryza nivara TaxID=4536 RepID=A0A0E0I469_ORYNI